MNTDQQTYTLKGPGGEFVIHADDKATRQMAMIFEGHCLGLGAAEAACKYGYSLSRYYEILRAFKQGGSQALIPKKTGPKGKYVRTETTMIQVVRHCFLDPEANAEVIAQKLRQTGVKISDRSVSRIIAYYGLQKKLSQVSTEGESSKD